MTNKRCSSPTLGNGAFRRIVGGIKIEVRNRANHAFGPTGAGTAGLLAWHELKSTMRSEMQNGIRLKVFSQIAIKGRKGMGWRHALFKQEAHGVALVAKTWLNNQGNFSKVQTKNKELTTIR